MYQAHGPTGTLYTNLIFTTMLWIETRNANSINKETEAQRLSKLPVTQIHLGDEFEP